MGSATRGMDTGSQTSVAHKIPLTGETIYIAYLAEYQQSGIASNTWHTHEDLSLVVQFRSLVNLMRYLLEHSNELLNHLQIAIDSLSVTGTELHFPKASEYDDETPFLACFQHPLKILLKDPVLMRLSSCPRSLP